jgi:hypothetical protein
MPSLSKSPCPKRLAASVPYLRVRHTHSTIDTPISDGIKLQQALAMCKQMNLL